MNESFDPHESDRSEDTPPEAGTPSRKTEIRSPGELLREAREAKGYSVDDLCAHTKLSPKSVNLLENNQFNELSQPVFARGYYRQCAKVLDMDSERLMAAYTEWAGESRPRPPESTSVNVVPQDVTPQHWRQLAVGLIVVVVVLIVAGLFLLTPGGGPDEQDTNSNTSLASGSQTQGTGAGNAGRTGANSQPRGGSPAAGSRANRAGGGLVDRSGSTPNRGNRRQPSGGRNVNDSFAFNSNQRGGLGNSEPRQQNDEPEVDPNHLELDFDKRSWIRVRDATGTNLASGIFEKGDTREFDGEAPYDIVLGFAPGVSVTIGGESVDVESHTRGDTTARFSVEAPDTSG